MNDLLTAWIRTLVPSAVGAVVGYFASKGIEVDGTALTLVIIQAATGVYYFGVRKLEARYANAGWLLGIPKPPVYAPAAGTGTITAEEWHANK